MLRHLSSSRSQFILMIGDAGVLCVPYNIPEIAEAQFAAHGDNPASHDIIEHLKQHRKYPVILLADMLAQDYRQETLPRLNLLDRPKLIERRMKQAFPQARLTACMPIPSSRTQVIMAGLHDDSPLFDWLDKLKLHHPRIGLLPLECAGLAMTILPDAKDSWAMIISHQRTGGFRQIVTYKGQLIFTRLTAPLPADSPPEDMANILQRDVKASLGYLGRLGLSDSSQLRVAFILPDIVHEAMEVIELPVHSLTLISPHKIAAHLHLPFVPKAQDGYGDLLFAGWVAQKRRLLLPLMPPEMKRARTDYFLRLYGMRVATLALISMLAVTLWHAGGLAMTALHLHTENQKLEQLNNQLAHDRAAAAPVTEPLGKLRQALARKRLFSEPVVSPWPSLNQMTQGFTGQTRVVKLNWQNDQGQKGGEVIQADLQFVSEESSSPTNQLDKEQIIARFQQVAQKVAEALPNHVVEITRYPFPAMPEESLSNSSQEHIADEPTAELTIRGGAP